MVITCCARPNTRPRRASPFLLPCPFCGGKASIFAVEQPNGTRTWEVDCENDDCEVASCTMLHPTKEEAAEAWNRRGNPPGMWIWTERKTYADGKRFDLYHCSACEMEIRCSPMEKASAIPRYCPSCGTRTPKRMVRGEIIDATESD